MADRTSLVIPLLASLVLHALVLAVGELAGIGEGKVARKEAVTAQYQAPPPQGKGPAPGKAEEAGKGARTISFETTDPTYRPYFSTLRRKISRLWKEPVLGPGDPGKGSLLVEFSLDGDGGLRDATVVRSSGVRGFDFAALEAVKGAAPYDPFPPGIPEKELRIRALFVYED